ncbi:MAG: response regulator [Clostridia bacterium]|nr:response regulator [Clostridia bacterium]
MMKVFLADDEIAIRENLRNSFPWEEKGCQLVGEAPDGEMALPMIRDLNPDILLTDIRMPFMDGIQLCAEVRHAMPWVGIIILSGYDDFAYAQKAISLGVQEYLLKPVTAQELEAALNRVRDRLLAARRERESMASLRERITAGNRFLLDKLLSSLFTEEGDRYEDEALLGQMRALGINLTAACYAVMDISFSAEGEKRMACREALMTLSEASGGTVFVCSAATGCRALVLGDNSADTEERAYSFAGSALQLPELADSDDLLLAIGETVSDYYDIRRSMKSARHVRHLVRSQSPDGRRIVGPGDTRADSDALEAAELSPLYERLQYAAGGEVEPILMDYTATLEPSLAVGYLRVAALITAQRIVHEAGGRAQDVLKEELVAEALHGDREACFQRIAELLRCAIEYRDSRGRSFHDSPIGKARAYLSRHYADPNLMLQDAANEVGMSQSHFSTIFAQETGITFTQYLTGLRIGKAKELLAGTDMRSSAIAFEVGYNDAHYFSYLFKKTTGMTPSEYRRSERKQTSAEEK